MYNSGLQYLHKFSLEVDIIAKHCYNNVFSYEYEFLHQFDGTGLIKAHFCSSHKPKERHIKFEINIAHENKYKK